MRWALALTLALPFAAPALAASQDDDGMKAAYCLGRLEFSEQASAGFTAVPNTSQHDKDMAAAIAKRADALRRVLARNGIALDRPPASDAEERGNSDQHDCVLDRVMQQNASAACARQAECDELVNSLTQ
jgi:hypothetical protein